MKREKRVRKKKEKEEVTGKEGKTIRKERGRKQRTYSTQKLQSFPVRTTKKQRSRYGNTTPPRHPSR